MKEEIFQRIVKEMKALIRQETEERDNSQDMEAMEEHEEVSADPFAELCDTTQADQEDDLEEDIKKELLAWKRSKEATLKKSHFPAKYRDQWVTLFIKYNTGIPSSAAVERLFSTAGDVLRPKRACLSEDNFEYLVFLKGNLHLLKQKFKTPPKDINELTMQEIIAFMKDQFDPKRFIVRERFKFWSDMHRKPGETIQELAARIRQDAATCDFSSIRDPQDEALRTRFICSVNNEAVLKALFKIKDDELNFTRAIQIATEVEDAAKVAKETVYGHSAKHVNKIQPDASTRVKYQSRLNKRSKSADSGKEVVKGYRCGKLGHKAHLCRFKDAICSFCKFKGHLQVVCMTRERQEKTGEVKHIYKRDLIQLVSMENAKLPKLEVPISIQGLQCRVELDTGTGGNFLSTKIWTQLGKPALQDVTVRYESASKHTMPVLGKFMTTAKSLDSNQECIIPFIVSSVPNLNLLGRDAIAEMRISLDKVVNSLRESAKEESSVYTVNTTQPDKSLQKACQELCDVFPDLFKPELGCLKDFELEVQFKQNAQPIFCKPRSVVALKSSGFNATTGTVRDGYELCVGPHGSGTRNTNSSLLLNFARSRRLRIAGSWYQRPELHRWTWYSNAGGVAKEIDHILVSTRWRILQNCRVYRSAEFFGTDHRLVVATLKLHVKSRRISRGNHTVFHLEKLKDLTCAHEYAVAVSNRFDVLGALGDPVELWDTFKRETLQAAKECIGERPRSRRGFVSTETLEKIEESHAARLAGNWDQHRALSRRTRTLLGRDKERYVRSLAEDVEGHLNANDLRPAYRALKKLRSKSPSRASAIQTADGRLVSDMDGQMARWAEYFGQLFTVDPPTEQLHTTGLQASLEVLVMALEALHEEAKPLGLEVSWLKTKVQVFGDLLDEAVQSVHRVARTLRSWKVLHTLVAQSIMTAGHVKKPYGGLA
ncbi:hypothetical protein GWK47_006041 [Chionoecetes opilio]|uniref:Uncharacterized protein n=1 Tax=Chionoecetes opilio TaxID=41210 RepID=A0A8J4Y942_CHIOP|nr:hypothetical protein GWK47_006041 [Chionoecetes opilio]